MPGSSVPDHVLWRGDRGGIEGGDGFNPVAGLAFTEWKSAKVFALQTR